MAECTLYPRPPSPAARAFTGDISGGTPAGTYRVAIQYQSFDATLVSPLSKSTSVIIDGSGLQCIQVDAPPIPSWLTEVTGSVAIYVTNADGITFYLRDFPSPFFAPTSTLLRPLADAGDTPLSPTPCEDGGGGSEDEDSTCPPRVAPTDVEVRFFSQEDGKRLAFDPDKLVSLRWGYSEVGGMDQADLTFALEFDPGTLAATGQDRVEFWVIGETSPRWVGTVGQVEAVLGTTEQKRLVCYGPLEDMNHVLLNKVILHPGGVDLAQFAAEILSDYLKRRPSLVDVVDLDLLTTGINLERIALTDATARAALEQVFAAAAGQAVWGWEVNPATGRRRFYVRPKTVDVFRQYIVGENVKLLQSPEEYQGLINAAKVAGGRLKFPQLLKNPSFEDPSLPNDTSGSLLVQGGFEDPGGWTFINSAAREQHGPNNTKIARTGEWGLKLDAVNAEAYQDVTVTPGKTYKAILYAARESGAHASAGRLLLVDGSDTYTLPLAPPSVAWIGGQDTTILGADNLSLTITPATSTVRVRLIADDAGASTALLIDDVTFNEIGAVGQTAWKTYLQHPDSDDNKVISADWNCRDNAWEGVSFVRLSVKADHDNRVTLAPVGNENNGTGGAHFQPLPAQALRGIFRVRMAPGLNSADGEARGEYREWRGDGHLTKNVNTAWTAIPNDGAWHLILLDQTADTDGATATWRLTFGADGVYDVDGASVRDHAAGETTLDGGDPLGLGQYQRGETFERYVYATDVCTPGSDAYLSESVYGLMEGRFTNEAITDWNAEAIAVIKAAFERYAVVLKRPKLTITHDDGTLPFLSPASGQRVRVSGLPDAFPDSWPSRTEYTWDSGLLSHASDLNRERPTLAKLLSRGTSTASSGGVNTGVAFGGTGSSVPGNSSGVTTAAPSAIAVGDGVTEYFPVEQLDFPEGMELAYDEDLNIATATPDGKVKVSEDDTTRDYLFASLVEGVGITLEIVDPGADEKVKITASAGGARYLPIANGDRFNPCVVFTDGALVLTEY